VRRALLLGTIVAAAAGIVIVSLVPGWVIHVRHQGGHGLTEIGTVWNAWQGRAWPILPIGVAAAALAGALVGVELLTGRWVPRVAPLAAAVVALGSFLAQLVPLDRTGYASRVVINPAWPVAVGIGLALVMVAAAMGLTQGWERRRLVVVGGAVVVLAAAAFGVRIVALNLAEGDPRSFRTGTYVRPEAGDQPAGTLVIGEDSYRVEGRWSGTFEGRGLVVVLTDDPACPDDRGSYRIFPAGDEAIRWNTIVDLCADGARARDLTAGTWEPVD
jgi:hypothetical protein